MAAQLASLLPSAVLQFCDSNGAPLVNGQVGFYLPGSTQTLQPVWADPFEVTQLQNPVPLDGGGRPQSGGTECQIFGSGQYQMVLYDQYGLTIWSGLVQDPLSITGASFGDLKDSAVGVESGGWRLCYGQSRPQTDPFWQFMLANALTAGWAPGFNNGNGTYAMPDLRGRALFGLDNMGGVPAGRITAGVSGVPGTTLLGAGGSQNAQQDTLVANSSATSAASSVVNDPTHTHAASPSTVEGNAASTRNTSFSGAFGDTPLVIEAAATGITVSTSVETSVFTSVASSLTGESQNMPPAVVSAKLMYVGA